MSEIENTKYNMLEALQGRVSSIAHVMVRLIEEGYVPNNNKHTIVNFGSALIDCYENIEIMTVEQKKKLDNLFNIIIN